VGQLVEASEPTTDEDRFFDTSEPTQVEDPSICPEDFFHMPNGFPENEEVPEPDPSSARIGLYKATEVATEDETEDLVEDFASFLRRVAVCRNVTGPNVESWVTAVQEKLADIGITTFQRAVAEVHTINSKLARAGHVRMFIQTLDLIVRLGVEDMRDGTEREMFSYLHAVATAKNLTGRDVRTWAMEVHAKLQVLDIATIKSTVSWIVTLNHELRQAGLSTMHRQTLDLMARKGVEVLLQSAPEEPSNIAAGPMPAPVASTSLAPELPSSSNPVVAAEMDSGKCSECNGPGALGEPCPDCEEDGGMFLNFQAGL
jgi:hypothetical protein